MKCCRCALVLCLAIVGCTTQREPLATAEQGVAEVRVDTGLLLAFSITRVSVEAADQAQDLELNPASGTFDGTMFLPSGTQQLVARAFSGETQVGSSHPTPVEVHAGEVVRATVRILDTTEDAPPLFGPIIDALTHPTKAEAGGSVTFTISVVAPLDDPVTYDWTSDCEDASFSAPHAATTSWSKPTQGTCRIAVAATSNGVIAAESFMMVVFPAGAGSGGVEVNGVFVAAPVLHLELAGVNCFVSHGGDASCPVPIASPGTTGYAVNVVSWGLSDRGTMELSDNCGGQFASFGRINDSLSGVWLPPVDGGICILTARAVNGDGIAGKLSAAVLVHPGDPRPLAPPPTIFVLLNNGCQFNSSDPVSPADCGTFPAGSQLNLFGDYSFGNGFPGSAVLTDDCGGGVFVPMLLTMSIFLDWTLPPTPGTTCTIRLRVTNFQGTASEATAHYHLF